jgi:hypothetical protein
MSFREYQEWIILLNAEEEELKGKASGAAAGSGNGSGAAWQKQMAMMKMISLRQQISEAGRKKPNGRNRDEGIRGSKKGRRGIR